MSRLAMILTTLWLCLSMGCWDLRSVDDLALVMGIGVDTTDMDEEMFQFSFIHPTFAEEAQDIRVVTGITGYSLAQGLVQLGHQTDERPVLGQLASFVFAEDLARAGGMHAILMEFDSLRDNHPLAWPCVIRGAKARDVLVLPVAQMRRVSIFLQNLFEENMASGRLPRSDLTTYRTKFFTSGITPLVPVIELTGQDGQKTGIRLAGVGVIGPSGKLEGHLSESETLMHMLLTDNILRGRLNTKVTFGEGPGVPISAYIQRNSPKVQVSLIDEQPVIHMKTTVELSSVAVRLPQGRFLDDSAVRRLETALALDLQGQMLEVIATCQKWGADVFGFGRHVYAAYPDWFQHTDWATGFGESTIDLEVRVRIKRVAAPTVFVR